MNKPLFKAVSRIVLALCLLCLSSARADWQPYSWLVTIETEEFPSQFQYQGSILRPLVLARVSYARADGSDSTPYETLWFCDGKPFGLDRTNQLNIDQGEGVAIKVIHKTVVPSAAEYRAAAKSILRLFLDVRINSCMVQSVVLPDNSFLAILNELQNDHFAVFNVPLERPYQIAALMFVQDESDQQTRTVCYAPNSPGSVSN
jgi:hypothetical protein